jgi:hypothetical protein
MVNSDEDPTLGDRCGSLDHLSIRILQIAEGSGDGRITIGETVTVSAELRDTAGFGYSYYPGVNYEVEPAGITVSPDSDFHIFALLQCESLASSTRLILGSTIGPGTVVRVTARAGALNQDCPNAPSSTASFVVVE